MKSNKKIILVTMFTAISYMFVQADDAKEIVLKLKTNDGKTQNITNKQFDNFSREEIVFGTTVSPRDSQWAKLTLDKKIKDFDYNKIHDEAYFEANKPFVVVVPTANLEILKLIAATADKIANYKNNPEKMKQEIGQLFGKDNQIKNKKLSKQLINFINAAQYLEAENLIIVGMFVLLDVLTAINPMVQPGMPKDQLQSAINMQTKKQELPSLDPKVLDFIYAQVFQQ